jgi:oxygen-independent coproporphyrinogen-3 oxidase
MGSAPAGAARPPRHVYVHVPFCARRCSYCDFAIAVRRETPVAAYVDGIRRELALRTADWAAPDAWAIDTLYLGGGTPSRLGAAGVAALMDTLRDRIRLAPLAEVTLEANPDDVTPAAARGWYAAGVNRISLGAQSFDDGALRWMHRTHTARDIARSVAAIRDAGIENISLDLIFALPADIGRDWERDLTAAIALDTGHLSLYGLTIEDHTPLAHWVGRGTAREAPEGEFETEFLRAHDIASTAGYQHYEVSNFARPGSASRHNSAYWSGVGYAGLGPAAHGYDGAVRRWNVAPYAEWVRCVGEGRDPVAGSEQLTETNRATERLYLQLRTETGTVIPTGHRSTVEAWSDAGWATLHGDRFRLTPLGWLRMDALVAELDIASKSLLGLDLWRCHN